MSNNNYNPNLILYDLSNQLRSEDGLVYTKGEKGEKGDIGDKGERGCMGLPGLPGPLGHMGMQGIPGCKGQKGEPGPSTSTGSGDKGDKGDTGEKGTDGEKGADGEKGETGIKGTKGEKGEVIIYDSSGLRDTFSNTGPTGPTGPQGPPGEKGEKGARGATGPEGLSGPRGLLGPVGQKGNIGEKGQKGIQGQKAEPGENLWQESWSLNVADKSFDEIPLTNNYIYFQGFWNNTTGDYTNIRLRIKNAHTDKGGGTLSLLNIGSSKIMVGIYDNGSDEEITTQGGTSGLTPWDNTLGSITTPWPRYKLGEGSRSAYVIGEVNDSWIDVQFDNKIYLKRNKIYFIAVKQSVDKDMTALSWNISMYGLTNDINNTDTAASLTWIREDNFDNNTDNWDKLPHSSYGPDIVGGITRAYHPPVRHNKALWFTVYGDQYAEGSIKGSKGDVGDKGPAGDTENLWYESWNLNYERSTGDGIDIENNHIYFQGFWNKTSGYYTNLKFRIFSNDVQNPNNSTYNVLRNSAWRVAIYTNGNQSAIDSINVNGGYSPWNTTDGISEPWPKFKLGEGIYGPGSKYYSNQIDDITSKDNYYIDIKFEEPIELHRNKIYFIAIKQCVDPQISASSWNVKLYGLNDPQNANEIGLTWERENSTGNSQWDEMPTYSYFVDTFNGLPVNTYSPVKISKSIWFILYGEQYTINLAIKGPKGQKGQKGETGAHSGNIWYESWNMNQDKITSNFELENNNLYFQGFWNKTTGYYKTIRFKLEDSRLSSQFIRNSKWMVAVYDNGAQDAMDGSAQNIGVSPWEESDPNEALFKPWPNNLLAWGEVSASLYNNRAHRYINVPITNTIFADTSNQDGILLKRNKIYYVCFKQALDPQANTTWHASLSSIELSNDSTNVGNRLNWRREIITGNTNPYGVNWDNFPYQSHSVENLLGGVPPIIHSPIEHNHSIWFQIYGDQHAEGIEMGPKGQKGEAGSSNIIQSLYSTEDDTIYVSQTNRNVPKLQNIGNIKEIFIDNSKTHENGNGDAGGPYLVIVTQSTSGNQTINRNIRIGINSVQETNTLDPYYPEYG